MSEQLEIILITTKQATFLPNAGDVTKSFENAGAGIAGGASKIRSLLNCFCELCPGEPYTKER